MISKCRLETILPCLPRLHHYFPVCVSENIVFCFQSFPVILIFDSVLWVILVHFLTRNFLPPWKVMSKQYSIWRVLEIRNVILGFASFVSTVRMNQPTIIFQVMIALLYSGKVRSSNRISNLLHLCSEIYCLCPIFYTSFISSFSPQRGS